MLTVVLRLSPEQKGQIKEDDDKSLPVRGGVGGNSASDDDDTSRGKGSIGSSDNGRKRESWGTNVPQAPFVLLLKKTLDLVLQPFQALQVCSRYTNCKRSVPGFDSFFLEENEPGKFHFVCTSRNSAWPKRCYSTE